MSISPITFPSPRTKVLKSVENEIHELLSLQVGTVLTKDKKNKLQADLLRILKKHL